MNKKLPLIVTSCLLLFVSCNKKFHLFEQKAYYGEATINDTVYYDYIKDFEAIYNPFHYTPLGGHGRFILKNDSVAYMQFVLRDKKSTYILDNWIILIGIPNRDGADFPVIGKEYPIEYSSLTDRTYAGGGNFYEIGILKDMMAADSKDLPLGIGGLQTPYELKLISLSGTIKYTSSKQPKNSNDVIYNGIYYLENKADEEFGKYDIKGKFNLSLEKKYE